MPTFFASVITMDHINLERDVKHIDHLGIDGLHIDIMDGNFVPRYGIYPEIVKRINDSSDLSIDLHIMTNDPLFTIDQFKNNGNIDYIRFHVESCPGNELRIIDKIREVGAKPIAAINLSTSFHVLDRLIDNQEINGIMLMGIHPGVLIQEARFKNVENDMERLNEMIKNSEVKNFVGLDGAVTFESIPVLMERGINNFIVGSSTLFKGVNHQNEYEKNISIIEKNWKTLSNFKI